jgi:hypothetical protein
MSLDALERFRYTYPVKEEIPLEQMRQKKIELVALAGHAESIRDYGGVWGVDGLYLLQGAKILQCSYAEMIDQTLTDGFWELVTEIQRTNDVEVHAHEMDFRIPTIYSSLRDVDVSLLYDVLLHQDNAVEVIRNVLSRTKTCVFVAQPTLKEELFPFPGSSVCLQFWPEELKDLMRFPVWWPKQDAPDHFDTRYWMWGHTCSFLRSVFFGYGWELSHLGAYYLSRHWDYALMQFVPRGTEEG